MEFFSLRGSERTKRLPPFRFRLLRFSLLLQSRISYFSSFFFPACAFVLFKFDSVRSLPPIRQFAAPSRDFPFLFSGAAPPPHRHRWTEFDLSLCLLRFCIAAPPVHRHVTLSMESFLFPPVRRQRVHPSKLVECEWKSLPFSTYASAEVPRFFECHKPLSLLRIPLTWNTRILSPLPPSNLESARREPLEPAVCLRDAFPISFCDSLRSF